MEWIKPGTKIDFVGKRTFFFTVSLIAVGLAIGSFFWPKPNPGIDFKGGTEIWVRFNQAAEIGKIRAAVESLNLGDVQIQSLRPGMGEAQNPGQDFLIWVEKISADQEKEEMQASRLISAKLKETFGENSFEELEVNTVSEKVSAELWRKAALALLYALIGILIYVGFRFEFKYALGAVLALFHDAIISTGFYNLIQREWSLAIIAGILTIIGYSVNDTIVIFDRIRETIRRTKRGNLREIINRSLNECLSRTIITNFATTISVVFLAAFGTGVIRDFSILMIFGMVVGTYSTIYIASSLVLLWEDLWAPKKPEQKKPAK